MSEYERLPISPEQRAEIFNDLDNALKRLGVAINKLPTQSAELNDAWIDLIACKHELDECVR